MTSSTYLLLILLAFVGFRVAFVGPIGARFRRLDNPLAFAPSPWVRALSTVRVHALGLSLLLWPATLSADYSFDAVPLVTSPRDPAFIGAALVYATLLAVTVALLRVAARPLADPSATAANPPAAVGSASAAERPFDDGNAPPASTRVQRGRVALFWWLLLGLSYAPAAHIPQPLSFVVAERLLYLPSAATSCLVAAALEMVMRPVPVEKVPPCPPCPRRRAWVRCAARTLLAAALVSAGARTMRRNLDWRDDTRLFTAAAAAYARSAKAHYQLADGLMQRGRPAEALPLLHTALAIEPNYHYAYLHLAKYALDTHKPAEAATHAAAALRAVAAPNAHGHALRAHALLELHRRGARGVGGSSNPDDAVLDGHSDDLVGAAIIPAYF